MRQPAHWPGGDPGTLALPKHSQPSYFAAIHLHTVCTHPEEKSHAPQNEPIVHAQTLATSLCGHPHYCSLPSLKPKMAGVTRKFAGCAQQLLTPSFSVPGGAAWPGIDIVCMPKPVCTTAQHADSASSAFINPSLYTEGIEHAFACMQ